MRVINGLLVLFLTAAACVAPGAVWAKEKEIKVSELMKDANEIMAQAQTAYVDGETKKAIEFYRNALKEIVRIETENPKRAATSEFAPVRFRKALCETEIDRIMLEEVNATARTVAVTDTRELEAKRAARHKAAETNQIQNATLKLAAKQEDGGAAAPVSVTQAEPSASASGKGRPVNVKEELEWAKDMMTVDHFEDVEQALIKVLKQDPANWEARFLMAQCRLRQGRPSDALVVLDDLMADRPKDEAVLLMASGANMASGSYSKAMDLLDKVLKLNPKRPDGYYDMAWLLLEMNPGNLSESEMYYRQAVKLGGVRDRELERRLGIKQK